MFLQYLYHPHNVHRHPLYAHLLRELQEEAEEEAEEEVEAEAEEEAEVEAEEEEEEVGADKQTTPPCPTSDSAETLLRYSREKERKLTVSSLNSNATTLPTSESQSLTPGSEKSSSPAPTSKAPLLTNGSTER